jgi:DNA helicase-2/ATP-dependent DNA helicase PcrA
MFALADAPKRLEADEKPWLKDLNPAQREAVLHDNGPLLVIAGAGSGKTKTLASRVANLLDRGVPPERILLLTFSRRAAREMLARVDRMVGRGASARVYGGTFHAIANRLLRLYGQAAGLGPDFTVLDQSDGADLMDLIRGEMGLASRERRFPNKDTLVSIYSRTVNSGAKLSDVLDRHFPWCSQHVDDLRKIFAAYTDRKREQQTLDYDDLLLYWRALASDERVGPLMAELFDHILVDEYQDTNPLQADILRGLRTSNTNITAVGDDAQAIYSFRAATNRNILDFPAHFLDTRLVTLEQNYRSTIPILEASNAVIELAPERFAKELWSERQSTRRPSLLTCRDEAEQSAAVCRSILEHREQGVSLREQSVLFRAGHHSDLLELELARRNIPFVKYGGLKFLESAHVKDALSILRILENPYDEVAWFRVLRLLEGVGPATARQIMEALGVRREGGLGSTGSTTPVERLLSNPPAVPNLAREGLEQLGQTLAICSQESVPISAQMERVLAFCEPVVQRMYSSPESRIRDLEQLQGLAGEASSRGAFLADLTIDPPVSTGDLAGPPLLDDDYLVLSTIHSAKGGEWDVVHVIHAADGIMPSDMATGNAEEIEEERRLFYVALTRAKDSLHVYFPLRYYHQPRGTSDPHSYAQLTRFLPKEARVYFEESSTGGPLNPRDEPLLGSDARVEKRVNAYLNALWD